MSCLPEIGSARLTNRDLVARVYTVHSERLIRLARILVGPDDALDVLSSAVVKTLAAAERVVVHDLAPYLTCAVYNEARTLQRRRRREGALWGRLTARPHAPATNDTSNTAGLELLQSLSLRQRGVIFLTYWADLPPTEIASALGISEGAVRRHLARARHRLRQEIER